MRKLGADLLHLEITTMVQPTIVSTKMVSPRRALLDLAQTYTQELVRQHLAPPPAAELVGGYETFQQLHDWAQRGIAARTGQPGVPTAEAQTDLARLYDIQDKADHLLGLFQALQQRRVATWDNAYTREELAHTPPPWPLMLHEVMLIRKFWEVGLEAIAMQTVIQADGDVITRIQPRYISADAQPLRDLHKEGLQISVAFWHELVRIVETFVSLFLRRVL